MPIEGRFEVSALVLNASASLTFDAR